MDTIGVVGIGAMGNGIAKNLIKAGYPLVVFRRDTASSAAAAKELESLGAAVATSLPELYRTAKILITCLPDSRIVEDLLIGKSGLSELAHPSIECVLDFSTAHPDSTRKIAAILADKGIEMLDTPMTGSVREAAEGTLKLIVGGNKETFERHESILRSVAAMVLYAGDHGTGNMVKLANNYLSILDQAVTARIAIVLEKNNIPNDVYIKFLSGSSANSGGFQLMMRRITTGDFSKKFELALAMKDIGYCRDVFSFPVTDTLYGILNEASDAGYGDKDIGTVYAFLREKA
jgi:3-hydroxyisobutyrate dehydrogenase-like beta-hydroxyacid dehydrogenase